MIKSFKALSKKTITCLGRKKALACCLFVACITSLPKFNLCHLLISSTLAWNSSQYKKMVQPLSATAVLSPEVVRLNIAYHMSHSKGMAGMCH